MGGMGGMGGMGNALSEQAAPMASMEMAAREGMSADAAADTKTLANAAATNLGATGTPGPNIDATVRSNFADTALWVGTLATDSEGFAEVEFDMPENLTTWKVNVWAMGHGTNVGEGHTEIISRKDLIVRLQAPRFFTETDEVVISANVHNYLDAKKLVTTKLILDGKYLVNIQL